VDKRNKRNKPTLSADAIQPCVPGLGLNRILEINQSHIRQMNNIFSLCSLLFGMYVLYEFHHVVDRHYYLHTPEDNCQ
jgi:hypothetical protein